MIRWLKNGSSQWMLPFLRTPHIFRKDTPQGEVNETDVIVPLLNPSVPPNTVDPQQNDETSDPPSIPKNNGSIPLKLPKIKT